MDTIELPTRDLALLLSATYTIGALCGLALARAWHPRPAPVPLPDPKPRRVAWKQGDAEARHASLN